MNNFKASSNNQSRSGSFAKKSFSGQKNFTSSRNFGDKKNFGNKNHFSERPLMYPSVCSQCGRNCEVPFKPTGEKPVYCSNCFAKKTELSLGKLDHAQAHEVKPESKFGQRSNNSLEDKLEIKLLEIENKLESIVFKLDEALMSTKTKTDKEFRTTKMVSSYKAAHPVRSLAPARTPRAVKLVKTVKSKRSPKK